MELAIIGLQNAGKSTFVQVITHGEFVEGARAGHMSFFVQHESIAAFMIAAIIYI